jgi:hypothetical protein
MTKSILSAYEVLAGGVLRQTSLEVRMDQNEIAPHIEDAEFRYVKPILGDTFYQYLVDNKLTDGCNYNTDKGATVWKYGDIETATDTAIANDNLFTSRLYKLCALAVWHQALPYIGVKTTNQGIMLNNTEFTQNVGFEGVRFLQQQIMENIIARQNELKTHLKNNESDFTSAGYGTDTDDCETENTSNNLGIIFH